MIKRRVIISLLYILAVFFGIHFMAVYFFGIPFSPVAMTGKVVDVGLVKIFVTDQPNLITIYSPENITYNFNKGEAYLIALNVSSNFDVDIWKYSLYDLKHGVYVEEDTGFVPNSSISAVRWGNILTVKAHEVDGDWVEKNVTFFVEVPNSAPTLTNISDELFVCEGENFYFEYNATDIDEESLTTSISFPNPFFERFISYDDNITSFFKIISVQLAKNDAGGLGAGWESYSRTITVYDGESLIDSKDVDITVIEVNNIPIINNQLGAQTVWLEGDDSVFYHQFDVSDVEDGTTQDGNLEFNLSFIGIGAIFDIGASDGVMQFTPSEDQLGDTYYIKACVEDNSLNVVHENFSVCEANGKRSTEWLVCDDFSLTVTDDNRAPEIIDWTPYNASFSVNGETATSLFAEVRDPDGTIPDIDWYVDGVLREHSENITNDSFGVRFGCEVSGIHPVKVVVSDGLLEDSFIWNVNVNEVECPEETSRGGGGGGGAVDPSFCREDWACGDWDVCQNAKRSFDSGVLAIEDYTLMTEICAQDGYDDERFCGFQIKSCIDLNGCNNEVLRTERPAGRQTCYFTENPSCSDGITNCHDGACESLVDCGGPCKACPTCSDGIQNQGEEDVDCGGPCPYVCEAEVPLKSLTIMLIILSVILVGVIGYFGYKLFLVLRERYYSY